MHYALHPVSVTEALVVTSSLTASTWACRRDVIRNSARQEFEAARFETDPVLVRGIIYDQDDQSSRLGMMHATSAERQQMERCH